jgi:hypothetical protein
MKFLFHVKGRTGDVGRQVTEENIGSEEGRSNNRFEKTA